MTTLTMPRKSSARHHPQDATAPNSLSMTTHRFAKATAAGLLLASLAACGGGGGGGKAEPAGAPADSGGGGEATDKVDVKDFAFKPKSIKVKVGTTVTWTFNDSADHTVASVTGGSEIPQSPDLKGGKTFTHEFKTAGSFPYICTIHNSMTGTVVVTAA